MIKRFSKNTIVLADQAIFSGGSFLITILLARILTPHSFGIYSSVVLFNFGVLSILNAFVIQPLQVSLEKVNNKKTYISFNFWLQFVLLILTVSGLLTVFLFKIDFLSNLQNIQFELIIFFTGYILHDYFRKLFLANSEVINAFIIDFITTGLSSIVLLYSWFSDYNELSKLLLWMGLCYLPGLCIAFYQSKAYQIDFHHWKSYFSMHLKQGKWLVLTTLTQWWSSNLFVVTAGVYLGVQALGAFRLVQSLFGILNLLLQTFENFVLPEASRRFVDSMSEAKSYLKNITKKSALIFGVILVSLFLFSEQIIALVGGKEYIEYAYIVKGMAVLYVFIFIGYPIRLSIRMLLLNRVFFTGYVMSFIFSICTFKFLLQHYQIQGAIFGLLVSQIITMIYWNYVLTKNNFSLWR